MSDTDKLIESLREEGILRAREKHDIHGSSFYSLNQRVAEDLCSRAADTITSLKEENERLKAALRDKFCPRPCNSRPSEFDVGDCVDCR